MLREGIHVSAPPVPSPSVTPVGSVPDGKVADFLTGKFVNDTPEEYVRQNIEKALVRQYKYAPADCAPEFPIKVGASRKRVDIVVFDRDADHTQANAYILVETKRADVKPTHRTEGVGQLQSYMASCLNVQYGMWTNGTDRFCFAKRSNGKGSWTFEDIIDIPAFGQTEADAQRPKRKDLKVATADNLLFAFRRCHNHIAAMCLYTKFGSRLGLLEAVHEYLGNDLLASIDADDPESAFSRYVEAHPRRYTFLVEAHPELLGMTPSRRADFVARLVATLGPGDPAAGRERLAMVHGQALLRQATAV